MTPSEVAMKQSRLNLLLVTQVRFVHRYCMRRWSKLPDNSIGKMHKVQERRCATPYSFENRDCYLMLLTLTPERLQNLKVRRAKRRRC